MKSLFIYILLVFILFNTVYSANDSTSFTIKSWRLSNIKSYTLPYSIDTALTAFQQYNIAYKNTFAFVSLGNIGQAAMPLFFFDGINTSDFIFARNFSLFFLKPYEVAYYNTTKPFTSITYSGKAFSGAKPEEKLRVLHTQNITKNWNVGLTFNLISSQGEYKFQNTKNYLISFFSSIYLNHYNAHTNFIINRANVNENGGMIFTKNSYTTFFDDTKNLLRNQSFFITQELKFGKVATNTSNTNSYNNPVSLLHTLNFSRYKRLFTETTADTNYYNKTYFNFSSTHDSSFLHKLLNTFELSLNNNSKLKLGMGIKIFQNIELLNYFNQYNSGINDTIVINNSTGIILFNKTKHWLWHIKNEYFFYGYQKNNVMVDGALTHYFFGKNDTSALSINATFQQNTPDYFEQKYLSNHFCWDTIFLNKEETFINVEFINAKKNLKIGIYSAILDNYIYFLNGMPTQNTSTFSISGIFFSKHFKWKKFNSINKLAYQYTTDSYLSKYPPVIFYNSSYLHIPWHFKSTGGLLLLQIGFEFTFYKQPDFIYEPAISQFGIINTTNRLSHLYTISGKTPPVNVFINMQVKRFRFFFLVENINYKWFDLYYNTIPFYFTNSRAFKFGMSWWFND